jgi:16S rRNA G966 N2-methylase RsmD
VRLTVRDRADAWRAAWPEHRAAWPVVVEEQGRDVIYATWVLGQRYGGTSALYGAYPPHYLEKAWAFFPDVASFDRADQEARVLHAFSGSLQRGPYATVDSVVDPVRKPTYRTRIELFGDVCPDAVGRFALVFADPPYSTADAERYGTKMINRLDVTRGLARVTAPGGFLCWLDVTWPMHRKSEWTTVGRIAIVRSTNHRVRMLSIFRRAGGRD